MLDALITSRTTLDAIPDAPGDAWDDAGKTIARLVLTGRMTQDDARQAAIMLDLLPDPDAPVVPIHQGAEIRRALPRHGGGTRALA